MVEFDEVTRCRNIQELNDFVNRYVEERGLEGEERSKHTWALFYTWRQSFLKREVKNLDSFIQKVEGCTECRETPVVFIRKEDRKVGLCKEHWEELAKSDISFSTEEEMVSQKELEAGQQTVPS